MADAPKGNDTSKDQFVLYEGYDRAGKSLLPEPTKALVEHLDKTEPLSFEKRVAIAGKSNGVDVYFVGKKETGTGKNVDVTHMIDSAGKTYKLSSPLTVAFEGRRDETAHHIMPESAKRLQTLQDSKELSMGIGMTVLSFLSDKAVSHISTEEFKVPPKQQISAVLGIPVPDASSLISGAYNAVGAPSDQTPPPKNIPSPADVAIAGAKIP